MKQPLEKRAGRGSLRIVRNRLGSFMKQNRRDLIWLSAITAGALLAVFKMADNAPGTFLSGFFMATTLLIVAGAALLASNSLSPLTGSWGEKFTSKECRKIKLPGVCVKDALEFQGMDVDHVVFGPGGVFAIESKFWGTDWDARDRLRRDIQQAKEGALKIRHLLMADQPIRIEVEPILVLWGFGSSVLKTVKANEIPAWAMHGNDLGFWLSERLKKQKLNAEELGVIGGKLDNHIARHKSGT